MDSLGLVESHVFHATLLALLGIDHERLTYRFQGLDQRLTGVESAHVGKELFALGWWQQGGRRLAHQSFGRGSPAV